jgi:hypothetical protein
MIIDFWTLNETASTAEVTNHSFDASLSLRKRWQVSVLRCPGRQGRLGYSLGIDCIKSNVVGFIGIIFILSFIEIYESVRK